MNILHWLALALYQRVTSWFSIRVLVFLALLMVIVLEGSQFQSSRLLARQECENICAKAFTNSKSSSRLPIREDMVLAQEAQSATLNACSKGCEGITVVKKNTQHSGLWSFKNVDQSISTYLLPTNFRRNGSQKAGIRLSDQKIKDTCLPELELNRSGPEDTESARTPQNTPQNPRRKRCLWNLDGSADFGVSVIMAE